MIKTLQLSRRISQALLVKKASLPAAFGRLSQSNQFCGATFSAQHSTYSTSKTKKSPKTTVEKKKASSVAKEDKKPEPVEGSEPVSREDQLNKVQQTLEKFVDSLNFWRDVNLMKKVNYEKGATEKELAKVQQYMQAFMKLAQERKDVWSEEDKTNMFLQIYIPLLERIALLSDAVGAAEEDSAPDLDDEEELDEDADQESDASGPEKQLPKSLQLFQHAFQQRARARVILDQIIPKLQEGESQDRAEALRRDITGRMAFHMLRIGHGKDAAGLFEDVLRSYGLLPIDGDKEVADISELDEKAFHSVDEEDAKRICFVLTNASMAHIFESNATAASSFMQRAFAWATERKLEQQLAFLNENQL